MEKLKLVRTAQQLKSGGLNTQADELTLSISKLPRTKELSVNALLPVVNNGVTESVSVEKFSKFAKGDKGDSAYQVWLSQGNEGTEDDYLASLKGDAGGFTAPNESINAGVNLDTMTTPGVYHQDTAANATLALNYPVAGRAGALVVYKTAAKTVRQYYYDGTPTTEYVRIYNGTSWQPWDTLGTVDRAPNWAAPSVGNTGINSLVAPGSYFADASDVKPGNGWPVTGFAATLQVYKSGQTITHVCQTGNGSNWTRYSINNGGAWSDWITLNPANRAPNWAAPAVENIGINSLTAPGSYFANESDVKPGNGWPVTGFAATLQVYKSGQTITHVCQAGNGSSWARYSNNNGGTWSAWNPLGGDIKLDPSENNLLSNSSAGLLLDRYKAPNVGITGTYISTGYGPDFTQDNAFSETGGVWRVKNTLMLSRIPSTASGAVIVDITLGKIPCDSSGIPLQYTLSIGTTSKKVGGVWRQHSVMILAIVGAPIKLMDISSGVLEDYKEGAAWSVSVKYTFGDMTPSAS